MGGGGGGGGGAPPRGYFFKISTAFSNLVQSGSLKGQLLIDVAMLKLIGETGPKLPI